MMCFSNNFRVTIFLTALVCGVLVFPSMGVAQENETLTILFEDHPPFTSRQNGEITGIFVPFIQEITAHAKLSLAWQELSFQRMKRELSGSDKPICIVSPVRPAGVSEGLKRTKPIGTFGLSGLLVRTEHRLAISKLGSVRALFEETTLVGGFVRGATYSVDYEQYLPNSQNKHFFAYVDPQKLAQLVAQNRIDFIFENEYMAPIHQKGVDGGENLIFVTLPDMPKGRTAHLLCSSAMPDSWMARLNRGIARAKDAK